MMILNSSRERWTVRLLLSIFLCYNSRRLVVDAFAASQGRFSRQLELVRGSPATLDLVLHSSAVRRRGESSVSMVLTPPRPSSSRQLSKSSSSLSSSRQLFNEKSSTRIVVDASIESSTEQARKRRVKGKYKRKRIPETERELRSIRAKMEREYEKLCRDGKPPSLWSFESLFPEPVWDDFSVRRDLFEPRERDTKTQNNRHKRQQQQQQQQKAATRGATTTTAASEQQQQQQHTLPSTSNNKNNSNASSSSAGKMKSSFYGGPSMMRIWREPRLSSAYLPYDVDVSSSNGAGSGVMKRSSNGSSSKRRVNGYIDPVADILKEANKTAAAAAALANSTLSSLPNSTAPVDRDLTRMVEDRMFGYRRTPSGDFQYDTSLMGDGAVQFREGVRLGNPLRINADRLNYFARKELQHGKIEEAQEIYEQAIKIDPRDGRAYLGISRCAERRRDLKLAREFLRTGIANSVSVAKDYITADRGANPFLLQALGCLEEKMGNLAQAEALYIAAAKSRPSHAAAWVALARLRTIKLGQSAQAGRICYQSAERELRIMGMPASSHVYTAWAALEYHKANDIRRARELFKMALDVDPQCSAAYLQLGVMEADNENWDAAQECFDKVLKFDKRNSRVLQAYALMETKRPGGSSRKAIGLFERAMKANRRDAGVLQAYGLYIAELGDLDAARSLLQRGTELNKRYAPVWQAWGVMETRYGSPADARKIFQEGIWACAQLTGCQSGGHQCARLWQAWGVLEAKEGDYPAARRCFSRALDADSRNIPAITAWALMEVDLGNVSDARSIFERALTKFAAGSAEKSSLWRCYELMEQRLGYVEEAQKVYQRAMREAMVSVDDEQMPDQGKRKARSALNGTDADAVLNKSSNQEVEVVRWEGQGGEVWLNDRAIESRVPGFRRKRKQ